MIVNAVKQKATFN